MRETMYFLPVPATVKTSTSDALPISTLKVVRNALILSAFRAATAKRRHSIQLCISSLMAAEDS